MLATIFLYISLVLYPNSLMQDNFYFCTFHIFFIPIHLCGIIFISLKDLGNWNTK